MASFKENIFYISYAVSGNLNSCDSIGSMVKFVLADASLSLLREKKFWGMKMFRDKRLPE